MGGSTEVEPDGGSCIVVVVVDVDVVVVTTPVFATCFYWRRRARLQSVSGRPAWRRAMLSSGGFLVGLAIAEYLIVRAAPELVACLPSSLTILFVVAVIADLVDELRLRAQTREDLVRVAVYHDVADALEDTAGQAVVIQGLHNRSLGYFFLPYVPLVVLAPGTAVESTLSEAG